MEAIVEQLQSLQRNLDLHTGVEGSSCPVCGITPYELAQIFEQIIEREVEKRIKEKEEAENGNSIEVS